MKVFDGCSEFILDEWPANLIAYVKTSQTLICSLVKVRFTQKMLMKWSKCHSCKPFFLFLEKAGNSNCRLVLKKY